MLGETNASKQGTIELVWSSELWSGEVGVGVDAMTLSDVRVMVCFD